MNDLPHTEGAREARAPPDALGLLTAAMTGTLGAGRGADGLLLDTGDQPPLAVGAVVNGRYTVLGMLGRGGMGWVYDVRDALHPSRGVALKLLHRLGRVPELAALFEAEFRTMAKLDHPNVARVFDFAQVRGGDDCLITMERIDGVRIDQVHTPPREWRGVVDHVVQVCRALSYVHSRRIVHFDLKPANILVDRDGVVRVVDFGIARESPLDTSRMGTLPYMAPEALLGPGDADHRADLYSLGITLYELLVGYTPFRTPLEALARTLEFPDDRDIPEWLTGVIRKLCERTPTDRYRSANAVIDAVNAGGDLQYEVETSATRQSYFLTPRFAGRQREHARVMGFLSDRLSGLATEPALFVTGAPGIGKSRLMREVRQQAQLERILFLESNCYEGGQSEYGPIADLLYQLVPLVEQFGGERILTAALPALVRIAPELARGRAAAAVPPAASAEDERLRMLEATSEFFVAAARILPYVVYINDLQWASLGPAQAFTHLAERIRDDETQGQKISLALVGSYRSDETENRPLADMLNRFRAQQTAASLDLGALAVDDVRDVIDSMLGVDDVPEPFIEHITRETDGNPFFIQEVMRVLFEDGTVYLDAGKWATHGSIGDLVIPASIAQVFRRRFDLLPAEHQNVLRILAVQARPLPLELLADLLGDRGLAVHAMRALVARGLVTRAAGPRLAYNIAHDRMRETIYADLDHDQRLGWHRRLAGTLSATIRTEHDEEPLLDDLAYHYWHAGIHDQALQYAIPAGRRAMLQYSNQAAFNHFEHALALLPDDDPRHTEISELHADMLVRLYRYSDALPEYHALLSRVVGQPFSESRVNGKISDIHMQRNELELAVDYGWKALETHGERRPRNTLQWLIATGWELCCFVLSRISADIAALKVGDASERVAMYDNLFRPYFFLSPLCTFYCVVRGWRIGHAAENPETRACANSGLAMMIGIIGLRRWAFDLFEQARRDAVASGSPWWIGGVEMRRGVVSRMAGIWDVESLDRAAKQLQDAGHMFDMGAAVFHAADAALHSGSVLEAFRRVRDYNAAVFRAGRHAPSSVQGTLELETTCRALREEPDVDARFQSILAVSLNNRDVLVTAVVLFRWGDHLFRTGHTEEGLSKLEEAYAYRRKHALVDNYTAQVLHKLPRAYLKLGQLDRQRMRRLRAVHAEAMRKTRRTHANWRPPTLVNQALLLEAAGKSPRADRCFEQAIDLARRQNAKFFVADGLYEWGVVLRRRGVQSAAREKLTAVLQIAETGGNLWLAARCRHELASLEPRDAPVAWSSGSSS